MLVHHRLKRRHIDFSSVFEHVMQVGGGGHVGEPGDHEGVHSKLSQAHLERSQAMSNFQILTSAKALDIDMSKIMKRRGASTLVSLETMKELEFFTNSFLTWLSRPP